MTRGSLTLVAAATLALCTSSGESAALESESLRPAPLAGSSPAVQLSLAQSSASRLYLPRLGNGANRGLEQVLHIGGVPGPLALSGDRLFVGAGPYIHTYAVSNPHQPERLCASHPMPSTIGALSTYQGFLLAAAPGSFGVYDLTSGAAPRLVSRLDAGSSFGFIGMQLATGDTWVAAPGSHGPVLIDLSDVASPSLLFMPSASNPVGAYQSDVATDGRFLFAATSTGLEVFDVRRPSAPVQISVHPERRGAQRVELVGDTVWTLSWETLRAISVEDPSAPVELGRLPLSGGRDFAVQGDAMLLRTTAEDGSGSLRVLDISNPANPVPVGEVPSDFRHPTSASIEWRDRWAYVSDYEQGVRALDMSSLAMPSPATTFASPLASAGAAPIGSRLSMIVNSGEEVIVVDPDTGATTSSLREPALLLTSIDDRLFALSTTQLSAFRFDETTLDRTDVVPLSGYPQDFAVADGWAAVAYRERLVGISIEPLESAHVATETKVDTSYGAKWVAVEGRQAWLMERVDVGYSTNSQTGRLSFSGLEQWVPPWRLTGIDLSDGSVTWVHEGQGWGVGGLVLDPTTDVLYVDLGLDYLAYDVSDPTNPVELGALQLTSPGLPLDDDASEVTSDPASPRSLHNLAGTENALITDGHFVGTGNGFVGAWRLSDPLRPTWAGGISLASQSAHGLTANGSRIAISLGTDGASLLELGPGPDPSLACGPAMER